MGSRQRRGAGRKITVEENGKPRRHSQGRQLIMFCVARRKSRRMLQSTAGIKNREYEAQRQLLESLGAGKINKCEFLSHAQRMLAERLARPSPPRPKQKKSIGSGIVLAAGMLRGCDHRQRVRPTCAGRTG